MMKGDWPINLNKIYGEHRDQNIISQLFHTTRADQTFCPFLLSVLPSSALSLTCWFATLCNKSKLAAKLSQLCLNGLHAFKALCEWLGVRTQQCQDLWLVSQVLP